MSPTNVLLAARDLVDGAVRGDNPEYERALVELTTEALGLPRDDATVAAVADLILGPVRPRPRLGVLSADVLRDDWVDRPGLSAVQRDGLLTLPDETLEAAMQYCIEHDREHFYNALDALRGDATRKLLNDFNLGAEAD